MIVWIFLILLEVLIGAGLVWLLFKLNRLTACLAGKRLVWEEDLRDLPRRMATLVRKTHQLERNLAGVWSSLGWKGHFLHGILWVLANEAESEPGSQKDLKLLPESPTLNDQKEQPLQAGEVITDGT